MEKQSISILLFLKKDRPFFISCQTEPAWGFRLNRLPGPVSRLVAKILNAYSKFKENFDPQEIVCSTLRFSDRVTIVHPAEISSGDAAEAYRLFLNASGRKHGFWMVLDAILASLGGLLTPLPGPNLFFFYPAARAVSHYFARKGVNTAKAHDKKDFTTNPLLDNIQNSITDLDAADVEIAELEAMYHVPTSNAC